MVPSADVGKLKITLCPLCSGSGFNMESTSQRGNPPVCGMCHGTRGVSPDRICTCGEPAVYKLDDLKGGRYYCGDNNCERYMKAPMYAA